MSFPARAEPVSATLCQPRRHASQQALVIVERFSNFAFAIQSQELRHALLELPGGDCAPRFQVGPFPCRQIVTETGPHRFDWVKVATVRRKPNTLQASALVCGGDKQEAFIAMPNLASGDPALHRCHGGALQNRNFGERSVRVILGVIRGGIGG